MIAFTPSVPFIRLSHYHLARTAGRYSNKTVFIGILSQERFNPTPKTTRFVAVHIPNAIRCAIGGGLRYGYNLSDLVMADGCAGQMYFLASIFSISWVWFWGGGFCFFLRRCMVIGAGAASVAWCCFGAVYLNTMRTFGFPWLFIGALPQVPCFAAWALFAVRAPVPVKTSAPPPLDENRDHAEE